MTAPAQHHSESEGLGLHAPGVIAWQLKPLGMNGPMLGASLQLR